MTGTELLVVLIMVLAGLIRGAFGFADALFAMPLLSLLMPSRAASPLMALGALMIAIVIIAQEWRDLDFRSAALLTAFGLIGVPLGVLALRSLDDRIVKSILGLVVITFATWSLKRPNQVALSHDRFAPIFGVLAGILGGAYNTSGPPLVVYAAMRKWPPKRFRAMMQAYCLFSSTWIITLHSIDGNITRQTLKLLAMAAPLMVTATLFGQRLTGQVATERFIRWVYIALIHIGAWLIVSCLFVSPQDLAFEPDATDSLR